MPALQVLGRVLQPSTIPTRGEKPMCTAPCDGKDGAELLYMEDRARPPLPHPLHRALQAARTQVSPLTYISTGLSAPIPRPYRPDPEPHTPPTPAEPQRPRPDRRGSGMAADTFPIRSLTMMAALAAAASRGGKEGGGGAAQAYGKSPTQEAVSWKPRRSVRSTL